MTTADRASELLMKEQKGKVRAIIFNSKSLDKLNIDLSYSNKIELLSLRDNKLTDLNFVKCLPNLWYLDIRNNYNIKNFNVLNEITVYLGFLGISVNDTNKISFLQISNLCIGVLYSDIKFYDDKEKNKFLALNNNKIAKLNDEFLDVFFNANNINNNNMNLKLSSNEINSNTSKKEELKCYFKMQQSLLLEINNLNHKINKEKHDPIIKLIQDFDLDYTDKAKRFFHEKEKQKYLFYLKLTKSFMETEDTGEREKLNLFNEYGNPVSDFLGNKIPIRCQDLFFEDLKLSEDAQLQVILLIILTLQLLNLLEIKFASYLINEIIAIHKDEQIDLKDKVALFFELPLESQISIYFVTLDNFLNSKNNKIGKNNMIKNNENSSIFNENKLAELLRILQIEKILSKINAIKQRKKVLKDLYKSEEFKKEELKEEEIAKTKSLIKEKLISPLKHFFDFMEEGAILLFILKEFMLNFRNKSDCNPFQLYFKENKITHKLYSLTNKAAFKCFKKSSKVKMLTANKSNPDINNSYNLSIQSKYPHLIRDLMKSLNSKANESKQLFKLEENQKQQQYENLLEFFSIENEKNILLASNKKIKSPDKSLFRVNSPYMDLSNIKNNKNNENNKECDLKQVSYSPNNLLVKRIARSNENSIFLSPSSCKNKTYKFHHNTRNSNKKGFNLNCLNRNPVISNPLDDFINRSISRRFESLNNSDLFVNDVRNLTKNSDLCKIEENLLLDKKQKLPEKHSVNNTKKDKFYDSYLTSPTKKAIEREILAHNTFLSSNSSRQNSFNKSISKHILQQRNSHFHERLSLDSKEIESHVQSNAPYKTTEYNFINNNISTNNINKDYFLSVNYNNNINSPNDKNQNSTSKVNSFSNEQLNCIFKSIRREPSRPHSREQDNYFINSNNANFNLNNHLSNHFNPTSTNNFNLNFSNNIFSKQHETAKRLLITNPNNKLTDNQTLFFNPNTTKNFSLNESKYALAKNNSKNFFTDKNLIKMNLQNFKRGNSINNNNFNNRRQDESLSKDNNTKQNKLFYETQSSDAQKRVRNPHNFRKKISFSYYNQETEEKAELASSSNCVKIPIILKKTKENFLNSLNNEKILHTKESDFKSNLVLETHSSQLNPSLEKISSVANHNKALFSPETQSKSALKAVNYDYCNNETNNCSKNDLNSSITNEIIKNINNSCVKNNNSNNTYNNSFNNQPNQSKESSCCNTKKEKDEYFLINTSHNLNKGSKPKKIKIGSTFYRSYSKDTIVINKDQNDFRSNIKKLVHHWNKNNSKLNHIESQNIRENDYEKMKKRQKVLLKLVIPFEQVNNLLFIENKDIEIQNTLLKKPKP